MAAIQAIHECLFCSQTFGTAAAKDDHVLEHFAQETCADCDRNLIRIGSSLYVKHDASVCLIRAPKSENFVKLTSTVSLDPTQDNESQCVSNITYELIKAEQPNMSEDSNEPMDFNVLDKHDDLSNPSTASEDDNQSITSEIECKLQELFCAVETNIDLEQAEENGKKSRDAESALENITDKDSNTKGEICGELFSRSRNLSKHKILKHFSDGMIFCDICARLFSTIEDRDVHRVKCALKKNNQSEKKSKYPRFSDNIKQNPITCEICSKVFAYKQSLQRHLSGVHKSIFCSICNELFAGADDRDRHQLQCDLQRKISNRKPEDQTYECDICGHVSKKKSNLLVHMVGQHCPETNQQVVCKICGKKFKFKQSLQRHNFRMHTAENLIKNEEISDMPIQDINVDVGLARKSIGLGKNYFDIRTPCEICGEILSKNALEHHRLMFHSPNGTLFCRTCLKIFPNAEELNAHRAECTTKPTTKYECDLCHKVYTQKFILRRHKRTKHDPNVGKFKCETCGTIYMREISLSNHQCKGKKRNPLSLRDLIPCETCGKIITRGAMRSHRIGIHSAPGTIFCRSCYKIFPSADDLKAHPPHCRMKVKYDVKCRCDTCGKIMANSRSLSKHKVSLHSAPGTIFCRTCVKKFKSIEELTAHKAECTLKRKLQKQNQLAGT